MALTQKELNLLDELSRLNQRLEKKLMALERTATPKPLRGSTKRAKARAKRQEAKVNRDVYAWVTARDPICRACHQRPTTERHHLRGRKYTTREDVVGVCDDCHDLLHVRIGGKKLKMYGNAEARTPMGNPLCLTVERLTSVHGWVKWCDR